MPANRIIFGRPTINIGQENLSLTDSLLSLLITENTSGLYRCEATFGNWGNYHNAIDYQYLDRALLDFGTALQIEYDGGKLFDGRIMGLEAHFPLGGEPSITVLAEDSLQDLRMTRRTRTFLDSSDSEVMGQIVADYSVKANIDIKGTKHAVLAQLNQSDLAFLRERARALDAELWIADGTLNIVSRATRISSGHTLKISYGRDLRSFSVLADLAHQRTSVTVSGWNVAEKKPLQYEATSSELDGEASAGISGIALLESIVGMRKEALLHTVPLSEEEAQYRAKAYLKMSARRFVVGHGVAETNSQLRVGNTVKLAGLGSLFSGDYYLSEVTHLFDGIHGMRTEFTAERPYIGNI